MRSTIKMLFMFPVLCCMTFTSLMAQNETSEAPAQERNQEETQEVATIAANLADSEDFSTLAAAVKAAGLMDALEGEGPFTVFAPTDEAFKAVGSEKLDELLKEENREKLLAILKAHVAAGEWTAEKIAEVSEIATVDGGSLAVTTQDEKVMVGDATIDLKSCLKCSNGFVHGIDQVLPARKQ